LGRYREKDTIAAEATPRGRGGISVLRVSGADSRSIVQQLFDKSLPAGGAFKFGKLVATEGDVIDEAIATVFSAPHSFTGEDVVELSVHGSPVVVAELLDSLYKLGARPADPGEFSLRAYLNGQLDLTQAEAIADLISASSLQSARQALKQLDGSIGYTADKIADLLERLMVYSEVELDFSEEDVELIPISEKIALVEEAIYLAEGMLKGYNAARRLREGVKVAITGAPNVGKSSIFNALVGVSRAIVHPVAGTTRDVISARKIIEGIEFEFFDTAGIRESAEDVEDEGIRRAIETARHADIILDVDSPDIPSINSNHKHTLYIRNKCDLNDNCNEGRLPVSALVGHGIEELKELILKRVTHDETVNGTTVTRERHYRLVTQSLEAMRRGKSALTSGLPAEMIAEEWREALQCYDELTGKKRMDELLETIFGQFCIGK